MRTYLEIFAHLILWLFISTGMWMTFDVIRSDYRHQKETGEYTIYWKGE